MKRLLMLLALLLTAATGVWADNHLTSSADIGKVVCTDHTVYATVAEATAAGKTPVAMIAYVCEELGTPQYGKALAISLEDAPIADMTDTHPGTCNHHHRAYPTQISPVPEPEPSERPPAKTCIFSSCRIFLFPQ